MTRRAKAGGAASKAVPLPLSDFDKARATWRSEVQAGLGGKPNPTNRSGVEVKAIYTPEDHSGERYMEALGFPGQLPMTRGIYPTMHRGRTWTPAPAHRPRRAGGLQRAAQDHPRARRHGGVADPLQLGLSRLRHRRHADRNPRHLRGDGELGRGHDGLPRRTFPSAISPPRSTIPRLSPCWRWSWRWRRGVASPGRGFPAPPTNRTTSRTSSPTTCSSDWRYPARGACCSTTSHLRASTCRSGTRCRSSASTCSRRAPRRPRRWG